MAVALPARRAHGASELPRPAVERAARGVGLAALRQPDPRHQPPRRAVRRVRRRALRTEGAARSGPRAASGRSFAASRGRGCRSSKPVGIVTARGEDLDAILITRHLEYSLPYRALFSGAAIPDLRTHLLNALAELLARLARARLLLGRLLALERALPPRRRRALRLPRRRGDGRAARAALRRAARVRPRHRADEHRRRAPRRRRRGRPAARPRPGRDGRGGRHAVHDALARADARGDVRPRRAVQARRAPAPAERPRLRRRGDPAGGDAERLPVAARPARRRAGSPPPPAPPPHRARRAGEPGAAHAERHRALPRGARSGSRSGRSPSRSSRRDGGRRCSSRRSPRSRRSCGRRCRRPRSSTRCSSIAGSCPSAPARTSGSTRRCASYVEGELPSRRPERVVLELPERD